METTRPYEKWGRETLEMIRRDFYIPSRKLYGEAIEPGHPPKDLSFNWGCGVLLTALVAGARSDRTYEPWLREFADESHTYWNPKGPVPGYDVQPGPKDVDRYYDDNEWMVMGLVETYEQLHDQKYLDWAVETLHYVLSGESDDLGGGIFWKEAAKTSKNTCSNAPAAAACLAVYRHTHDRALLAKATQLYSWTKKNLMDPGDHLFWDSVNLHGKIEKTKWSYNTALMIRTAADLYDLTHLPSYQQDAVDMTQSSVAHWLVDGKLKDPGRFAHLLFESWAIQSRRLESPSRAPESVGAALEYIHESGRSKAGHYPDRWSDPAPKPNQKVDMIDQASAARAFFIAAEQVASPSRQ